MLLIAVKRTSVSLSLYWLLCHVYLVSRRVLLSVRTSDLLHLFLKSGIIDMMDYTTSTSYCLRFTRSQLILISRIRANLGGLLDLRLAELPA